MDSDSVSRARLDHDFTAASRHRRWLRRTDPGWVHRQARGKRARGFLVSQKSAAAPLLLALFDGRVLHVVRKGYSAQDQPGERYDVYVIDYGASGATPGTFRDLHAR